MQFKYIPVDTLPRLAWCARIDKGRDTVVVYHGIQVETQPEFFAEGVWNGEFNAHDFISATIHCGTGAALDSGRLRVCASTDKLSPLFSIRKPNCVFISNSPLFALSAAEEMPDPAYPFYAYDFLRIWRQGIYGNNGAIRTASRTPFHLHFCTVMMVDRDLSVSFERHPTDPCPDHYNQYKQLLTAGVKAVLCNGEDPQRRAPYTPLSTISKGYDSCTTSALATSAGCKEAITFTDSREDNPAIDSGAEIARIMGMNCTEHDRWAYLKKEEPVDAEFALLTLASNAPVAAVEDMLPQRIMVTGHLGDIWSKTNAERFRSFREPYSPKTSGMGQLEYRLRVGYQTFIASYIGAIHSKDIQAISNSDEMQRWRIDGHYDKPIPRRILEEAGVPGDRLAVKKHAGGHAAYTRADNFSPKGLIEYEQFVRKNLASVPKRKVAFWYLTTKIQRMLWRLPGKMVPASMHQNRTAAFLYPKALRIPWKFMFLFQWSFESLKGRYQLPKSEH